MFSRFEKPPVPNQNAGGISVCGSGSAVHAGSLPRIACVVMLGVLGVGVWANLPYLVVEHRRLEDWKIAGLYIGDAVGFLWFARFVYLHGILRFPLAPIVPEEGRRSFRLLVWSGIAAVLLDCAFTLYLFGAERSSYERGQVAEAQVVKVVEHRRREATVYELDCAFRDAGGAPHEAHVRVRAEHHELPAGLPAEAARMLEGRGQHQSEHVIPIRYDPQFPARAWVNGLGWEDENGLYWFSVGVLCVQAAVMGVFFLLLVPFSSKGEWPWWWDMYKVLPLAAETFCMLMMGLIDRLMDSLT
jgi:hypothetical protein